MLLYCISRELCGVKKWGYFVLIYSLSSSDPEILYQGTGGSQCCPCGEHGRCHCPFPPQPGGLNHRRVLNLAVGVEIKTVTLFFTTLALKLKNKVLESNIGELTPMVTLAYCFIQKQCS